ncbi:MAG: laccase domain-containing protein, partial [bacterium]
RHDPGNARFFAPGAAADRRLFDLPAYVLRRLEQAGVGDAVWTGDDTRTDATRFYSNRRAYLNGEADFGRLMSAISLG